MLGALAPCLLGGDRSMVTDCHLLSLIYLSSITCVSPAAAVSADTKLTSSTNQVNIVSPRTRYMTRHIWQARREKTTPPENYPGSSPQLPCLVRVQYSE